MDRVLSNKKAIILFMAPAILLFFAIILIPIGMSVYYSLTTWNGMGQKIFVGFDNYTKLVTFMDGIFLKSVMNSIILAILSLLIQLPIGMVLALILAKGVRGENKFITIFFIPVIISTVAIGQLWIKIYNPDYGLLNTFLRNIGLEYWTKAWLGDKGTALIASLLPIVWQYIGYYMLLFYSAIKSISGEVLEAAKVDGANYFCTCTKIILPQIKPMIKVAVSFSIIGSLKVFDLIYVLTNGGPSHATEVPSTLMVWTIFKRNEYGFGSAMAICIILECFIAMYLVKKCFGEEE